METVIILAVELVLVCAVMAHAMHKEGLLFRRKDEQR